MFKLIRIFLPYGYDIIPIFLGYNAVATNSEVNVFLMVIYLYISTRIAILIGKAIASFMGGVFFAAGSLSEAFVLKLFFCFGPQIIAVYFTSVFVLSNFVE